MELALAAAYRPISAVWSACSDRSGWRHAQIFAHCRRFACWWWGCRQIGI